MDCQSGTCINELETTHTKYGQERRYCSPVCRHREGVRRHRHRSRRRKLARDGEGVLRAKNDTVRWQRATEGQCDWKGCLSWAYYARPSIKLCSKHYKEIIE